MPRATIELFTPHQGQMDVIQNFADSGHKFGIVSCGRQFGKSLLASNLLLYWLLESKGSKGGWISPIYSQAKKVYKEIVTACNGIISTHNGSDLIINFVNGSSIQFLSAERYDSIRGFSFHYCVIDEAAYVKEQALLEAILPTLTALGKKCLIISTPKGRGNWFFNWHQRGLEYNDTYISFSGISESNPYVDKEFIREQKKSLPLEIYKQEYLADFTDNGNDVFVGLDQVCILNNFSYDREGKTGVFCGVDTGINRDFSILTILSESGRVLEIDRINGITVDEIGAQFVQRLRKYELTGGYIEVNGIGQALYERIKREIRPVKSFVTTNDSKVRMIRKLILDIQNQVLELPSKELYPILYNELSAFTYKISPNGSLQFGHPSGGHDDTVMSLAMANLARTEIVSSAKQFYVSKGTRMPERSLKPRFGTVSGM